MPFNPTSVINSSQDDKFHLWSGGSLGDGGSFDLGWTDGDGSEAGLWDNFMHVFNDVSGATAQQTLQSNQQEFNEYMYNQYNSPEALVRQFRDAGLNTNLLGSTSFGTAQSSAGAPGVNGTTPVQGIASAAQAFQAARSSSADVPLKAAETQEKLTLPALNKVLTTLYGNQANLTEVEFDIAKKGMDWTLKNMEFTAKNAEQGYYNAIQMFNNLEQEWENLIKTGQVLDQDAEYKKWLAQTQQKIYNFWVDHNFPPDMNYLDYIWNNYLINKDYAGWQRFVNGQFQLSSMEHRNAAKYGAYGSKLKLFGQEVDAAYLVENGKDLGDYLIEQAKSSPSFKERLKNLFGFGDDSVPSTEDMHGPVGKRDYLTKGEYENVKDKILDYMRTNNLYEVDYEGMLDIASKLGIDKDSLYLFFRQHDYKFKR